MKGERCLTPSRAGFDSVDFIQRIGSQAWVSLDVRSGIPQEAAEWLKYMTAAPLMTLANQRAVNDHPDPY